MIYNFSESLTLQRSGLVIAVYGMATFSLLISPYPVFMSLTRGFLVGVGAIINGCVKVFAEQEETSYD
jgi:hypothetical protein